MQDHCAFAATLFAYGIRVPTRDQVQELRDQLAQAWLDRHGELQMVAETLDMTSQQYVDRLRKRLWGGIPDIALACELASTTAHHRRTSWRSTMANEASQQAHTHPQVAGPALHCHQSKDTCSSMEIRDNYEENEETYAIVNLEEASKVQKLGAQEREVESA